MKKFTIPLLLFTLLSSGPLWAQEKEQDSTSVLVSNPRSSLSIMPVFMLKEKFGFGLCYEYFLGADRRMSLSFPLFYSFRHGYKEPDFHHDENHRFANPPQDKDLYYRKDEANGSVYFNPGVKVYPGKGRSKVKYALGVSLLFNSGSIVRHSKDYELRPVWLGGTTTPRAYERTLLNERIETLSVFKMGALFTNSIYFYTDGHIFGGAELGLGYGLVSRVGKSTAPNEGMMQGALKVGYAW